ncbi:MAG: PAS domain S-box protein [Desulfuromonadales bacterium]|nr:MAG: PAS domain S-box protein [Desulfuromonadales bacterium]
MPSPNQRTYLIVGLVFALLLLGVLTGAFVIYRRDDAPLMDFLGLVLILLVGSFVSLAVSYRRSRSVDELAHVTELMQIQRELDKVARRYKSLLEGAGNAIFVFNADNGLLVEVNRRGIELLGCSKEEMLVLRGKDLVAAQDQEKFSTLVLRVARRGRGRSDGINFRRCDGELFLGEVDARLIDLGDEKVVHATVRDVTHRQRSEHEIRQRNRELSTLVNIITRANQEVELEAVLDVTLRETIEAFGADGGGIHLMERDDRLRPAAAWNITDRFAEALGGGAEAGLLRRIAVAREGLTLDDLGEEPAVSQPAAQGWKGFAGVPLTARNRVTGVMYLVSRGGRTFSPDEMALFSSIAVQMGIVIDNARLFNELKWKSEELMGSFRLLERSSHELALSQHRLRNNLMLVERANQELERIDRMKSSFLGMISHEFRTPLTSIISGADFLLSSPDLERHGEVRRVLDMIHQGGERLSEIVNDILKVTKLEANNSTMAWSPLHVSQVFDQVLVKLEPLRAERNLKIVYANMDGLPYCSGDRECFEEIFTELLENSIKFTPDGGTIMIAARLAGRQAIMARREILARFNPGFLAQMGERCYLEVEVRDNGVGVGFDEQVKIFDKFYEVGDIRHHSSGKYKFQGKGTGLGLAIVKGMVEAHGGMVWVESAGVDPDARFGSAFFVLLPLEECLCQPSLPLAESAMRQTAGGGEGDEE